MVFQLVAYAVACITFLVMIPFFRRRLRLNLSPLRHLPGPESASFTKGVAQELHGADSVPYRERVLTSYGRVMKVPMLFGDIEFVVSDPLALSTMFGTYRDVYDNPEWVSETMNSVFGPGLLSVRGKEHITQRKHLNPVFSVRYLRDMVPLFRGVAQELISVLHKQIVQPGTEVDVSQYFSRYSLECIGRSGLGYSFGHLENHGSNYSHTLRKFGPAVTRLGVWRRLLPWFRSTFPKSWLRFATEVFPWEPLRNMRAISDSVCGIARQILRHKVEVIKQGGEALANEVGEGKDLMSVLLKQNSSGELSEDSLIGHMSLLLLAGSDTTATTLSRTVELLAHHPEVQHKLRLEVISATHNVGRSLADFDYEAYTDLPYLEAIVKETIRMYPVFDLVPRVAEHEDTVLPLGTPVQCANGQIITELAVPADTMVWVNVYGINHDKDIWGPDADDWKPERWLTPLPSSVAEAHIPSIYANTETFFAGSRACIGYNMALTELRIALAHLILAFEFAPSQKKVIWRLGTIVAPWVEGSAAGRPELPIMMSCNAA